MATGLHKDLPDAELHAAKGAFTATSGHVLTADGAGSATFQPAGAFSVIFGSQLVTAESAVVSTTLSTTFQNKLTLTTPNLPLGTYRLDWFYQWNHDATNSDFEAQILQGATQLLLHKQEPKDAVGTFGATGTSQRYMSSGFYLVTAMSGVQSFSLQYRTDNAAAESSIWEAKLMLYRLS